MSLEQKLTKKKRKGIAFRNRKASKSILEGGDVPEQDLINTEQPEISVEQTLKTTPKPSTSTSKRKRAPSQEHNIESPPAKRKKTVSTSAASKRAGIDTPNSSRYILFLGNIRYTTTKDAVEQHFAACDPPPTVRLITPKGSAKSKGCAFLEFTHRNALQQALKLHHTELEGRKINVELTAGGGGKSEARLQKLKDRNKSLSEQRRKQSGGTQHVKIPRADGKQRTSGTSGEQIERANQRTWSVGQRQAGEKVRGGERHRGGTKKEDRVKPYKPTGANAIAVG